jgi:hypothetical protein
MRPEKSNVLAVSDINGSIIKLVFLVAHRQRPMPLISCIYDAIAIAFSSLSANPLACEV